MNALELHDATVTRGGRVIWRDANVSVAPGTVTAVLGPNGAGKSTLLLSVLGLVSLSEGSLEVLGESPRRGNPRVGYMPQSRREADQGISGREYVGLGYDGTRFGWRRGGAREKAAAVQEALSLTGARAFADRPLRTLSGGQRQRVALAHATVFRPQLLLLDEPMAALDLAARAEIADLINLIRDTTGTAVIVVVHDLNPLSSLVDQVLWIARHQIRSGTLDEVVNESVLSDLYGHAVEIVVTPRGRRVIVGLEEEFAHPHPHPHVAGHDHPPLDEEAHEHFAEFYGDDS
ncbi:MAG TPA: ATP-binding cassette domain-containing protein [Acidimicrobiales bacterium]|nr:ATP-binding cassette domain-containing protein [Acidimicrobiales bacterium]